MLKSLHRKLNHKDSTEDEIRERTASLRKCTGRYCGHAFQIVACEKGEEMPEAAARFNQDDNRILAFWNSQKDLDDYLKKLDQNRQWITDEELRFFQRNPSLKQSDGLAVQELWKIRGRAPNSPIALSQTAVCGLEFNYAEIQDLICKQERKMLAEFGTLPKKPSMTSLWKNEAYYSPYLKISWEAQ